MRPTFTLLIAAIALYGAVTPLPSHAQSTPITRAEAARILLLNRTDHVPLFPNKGRFPDVPDVHPSLRFLLAAERYGILSEDPATHLLRPDGDVNRATFLKMLTLTFGLAENLPYHYKDVRRDDWFARYAGLAEGYGIFGTPESRLQPNDPVSQDEVVHAVGIIQSLLSAANDTQEQAVSQEQAEKKLQLYVVISSKRLRTVFEGDGPRKPFLETTPAAKLQDLRQDVLNAINRERAKVGSPALTIHPLLNETAQQYGERMADDGFFSHVTPDGQTLRERIGASGYSKREHSSTCNCIPGIALAENLARGQRTPEEAVNAWMQSQSHRAALLDPVYTETGIGIAAGIWVQHFGGVLLPEGK